jgi:hypothetical protein
MHLWSFCNKMLMKRLWHTHSHSLFVCADKQRSAHMGYTLSSPRATHPLTKPKILPAHHTCMTRYNAKAPISHNVHIFLAFDFIVLHPPIFFHQTVFLSVFCLCVCTFCYLRFWWWHLRLQKSGNRESCAYVCLRDVDMLAHRGFVLESHSADGKMR